jgi:hypothetical protein
MGIEGRGGGETRSGNEGRARRGVIPCICIGMGVSRRGQKCVQVTRDWRFVVRREKMRVGWICTYTRSSDPPHFLLGSLSPRQGLPNTDLTAEHGDDGESPQRRERTAQWRYTPSPRIYHYIPEIHETIYHCVPENHANQSLEYRG